MPKSFHKKELVIGFALFSLFFGAGNLILPPMLGFKAGESWPWVIFGFAISAVLIPIFGLLAHARLQGTLFDFAKKVSPRFSLLYCLFIYAISIALPSPRTASVTHEMAIQPLFATSPWLTSSIYFCLVLIFVLNRSKILDIIGKFLTPAIILILLAIIVTAIFGVEFSFGTSKFPHTFSAGILEGYQTFDAIGSVVVGGVVIISINLKHTNSSYRDKKAMLSKGGVLAGAALFLIYGGLILTGALFQNKFDANTSRTGILTGISLKTLGSAATLLLSILVSLACFTTAVGIVTGAADFIKGRFNHSQNAYTITAVISSILGVVMGQFDVGYIITVALPALMFIYPLTIVLILLNVLPEKYASKRVFRWVALTTLVFSIPDFMASLGYTSAMESVVAWLPLAQHHMGWVVPALIVFVASNGLAKGKA